MMLAEQGRNEVSVFRPWNRKGQNLRLTQGDLELVVLAGVQNDEGAGEAHAVHDRLDVLGGHVHAWSWGKSVSKI